MPVTFAHRVILPLAGLAFFATACTTNPETGKRELSKAGIGAGIGAIVGTGAGALVGGKKKRTEMIVGAGIGALAGAGIGAYMDAQEKKLREKTAGTGVEVARQGDELTLKMPSGITFDVDSSMVKPQFQPSLAEVASVLTEYDKTYIDVLGYTDSSGSDSYNQALSERRAQAVASYLTSKGVQPARIAAKGYGETMPVADNATEAGKAANRRVEIKLVPVTEQDVSASS